MLELIGRRDRMEDFGTLEKPTVESLREIKDIADANGVRFWLDQGALLGAVRDGKLITYDHDVDLGILYKDVDKLLQLVPIFKQRGFTVRIRCNDVCLVKNESPIGFCAYQPKGDVYLHHDFEFELNPLLTSLLSTERLQVIYDIAKFRELQHINGRFARIVTWLTRFKFMRYFFQQVYLKLWKLHGGKFFIFTCPKRFYDNLENIEFYGMTFNAPSPVKRYLEFKFGKDWRRPNPDWVTEDDDGGMAKAEDIDGIEFCQTLKDVFDNERK